MPRKVRCPYSVVAVCKTCFTAGQRIVKEKDQEKCSNGHSWSDNILVLRGDERIRELPAPEYRKCAESGLCPLGRKEDGKCIPGMPACPYPHSESERVIWKWQLENKVTSSEALVKASSRGPERAGSLPPQGEERPLSRMWGSTENIRRASSADTGDRASLDAEEEVGEWHTVQGRRMSLSHTPVIKSTPSIGNSKQNSSKWQHLLQQHTKPVVKPKRKSSAARNTGQRQPSLSTGFVPPPVVTCGVTVPKQPKDKPNTPMCHGPEQTPASSQKLLAKVGTPQLAVNSGGAKKRKKTSTEPVLPTPPPKAGTSAQTVDHDGSLTKNGFPLSDIYNWKIACFKCLQKVPEQHSLFNHFDIAHACGEDTLAVRKIGSPHWQYIRERLGDHAFLGNYQFCRNYTIGKPCTRQEKHCSFAHNDCEKQLWTLEKDGKFNISEFIKDHLRVQKPNGYSLARLKDHGGEMMFLCRTCFFQSPQRISEQEGTLCKLGEHQWSTHRMLMHILNGRITPIKERPFKHKGAFFNMCYRLHFCLKADCRCAHYPVERAVWMVQAEMGLTREQILDEMKQASELADIKKVTYIPLEEGRSVKAEANNRKGQGKKKTTVQEPVPLILKCPHRLHYICGLCNNNGQIRYKCKDSDRCTSRVGHPWSRFRKVVCQTQSGFSLVRALPDSRRAKYAVCRYFKGCFRFPNCPFAHSEIEKDVWEWQQANNVKTQDELLAISEETHRTIQERTNDQPPGAAPYIPTKGKLRGTQSAATNPYYCKYCATTCNGQSQWDDHRSAPDHVFNVNSDKDHQWNYRQPPWGVRGKYQLCGCTCQGDCPYYGVDDDNNACGFAHCQEELDEWRERLEWRKMKSEMARKDGVFSYMDDLLDELEQADQTVFVLSDAMDDVTITSGPPKYYTESKTETFSWKFTIIAKNGKTLEKVALLNNKDRLHFNLDVGSTKCQSRSGEDFITTHSTKKNSKHYEVHCQFESGMYGTFRQRVVFDFGSRPVLYRDIEVGVGDKESLAEVRSLREELNCERWTSDNKEIIRLQEQMDPDDEELLKKYKALPSVDDIVTRDSVQTELKSSNYVHKMHQLLNLEEFTQHKIISSLKVNTTADVSDKIIEDTGMQIAPAGELFARLKLEDELTYDTDAGALILSKVKKVLITTDVSSKKVYEVKFVEKEKFDFDGRNRDRIYLHLHADVCTSLQLSKDTKIELAIQFQMDRKSFVRMHYALDQLDTTDVIFPNIAKIAQGLKEEPALIFGSSQLNDTQMKIIKHIAMVRSGYTPPMIVYGPFGTGKTETLAQATKTLVENMPTSRILICTHSNSAADVYLAKYLGDMASKLGTIKRVTATEKKPSSSSKEVLKYCFLSEDHSQFVDPKREELEDQQVIITTFAHSLYLSRLGLQGHFTHIFIDEAGQALECETIIPLLLVRNNTCVVLAGDHIQISPKVYSKEAARQGFHVSLLERLFYFYQRHTRIEQALSTPLYTLLTKNYRSHRKIVTYLAKTFYSGKLEAGKIMPDCEICPLMFIIVNGEETVDNYGTSCYNVGEAKQVCDDVEQLLKSWPQEWQEKRPDAIAVVTPYQAQVNLIRKLLRQKGLYGVVVEMVHNIQGREFRAMFISTVRTHHMCRVISKSNTSDYGFLTDRKLLNTAMTRAQSLVAVVGDPIALCSIGDCLSVWRTFIEDCEEQTSIRPSNINLSMIKTAVELLHNDPSTGQQLARINQQLQSKKNVQFQNQTGGPACGLAKPAPTIETNIEADEILKQLALEVMRNQQQQLPADHGDSLITASNDEEIRVDCFKITQTSTSALLKYSPRKRPKRRLLGANDSGKDYDSEDDGEEQATEVHDLAELKNLLATDKERYKECIFHSDRRSMHADIVNRQVEDGRGRIEMSSRLRCGQAFDNDRVVVEILGQIDGRPRDKAPLGQVHGVLKRAIDPTYKSFVCTVDPNITAMMAPINKGLPRIKNLTNEAHPHRKGYVTVYKFTGDRCIDFDRYEAIDELKPKSKLFKVRYLKWDPGFQSPLGIVVDILEEGNTIEKGMKIVNTEHRVHLSHNSEVKAEVDERFPLGYKVTDEDPKGRTDLRDLMIFAIDPESCEDVDDCLSFETEDDGHQQSFVIGVHIADVSHFVKRGSATDEEAKNRGTSLYPPGRDVVHMLPSALSTDILSLHAGEDRLTLSIFITVDEKGKVLKTEPKQCMIRSKHQLSYKEAEWILHEDTDEYPKELKQRVWHLYNVAQQWRRERKGNAALYQQLDEEDEDSSYAHLMVSEIMMMANQQVAQYLSEKYPNCTPLRRQVAPNDLELDEWKEQHEVDALNSVVLRRPFVPDGWTCECKGLCECVSQSMNIDSLRTRFFDIKTEVWTKLLQCMHEGDEEAARKIILNPENHPQLWVAERQLRKITNMADYVCSDQSYKHMNMHYSENMPVYTHFTSPIRRYLDIVVHRLLKAAMEGKPCPYEQEDIGEICNLVTAAARRSTNYERTLLGLHMGSALQTEPLVTFPVIDEVDDHSIRFSFLNQKKLYGIQNLLKLSHLGVAGRPEFVELECRLLARWQQRIYNLGKETAPRSPKKRKPGAGQCEDELVRLNPNRFVKQIPMADWQNIIQSIQANDIDKLWESVSSAKKKVRDLPADHRFVPEVTSEMRNHEKITQHHCHFEQTMQPGHVEKVQLAMGMYKGLMAPRIQLLNLSPNFDICIEHLTETQDCFARLAVRKASCVKYDSIEIYRRAWLPVLAMESATGAVRDDANYSVRNVTIDWTVSNVHGEDMGEEEEEEEEEEEDDDSDVKTAENKPPQAYEGVFELEKSFCKARHIKLFGTGEAEMTYDYLCVRYAGITADTARQDEQCIIKPSGSTPVTWVGHCLMTNATPIEGKGIPGKGKSDDIVRVKLRVHQSSMPFPSKLSCDNTLPCTVEFIPKSLPYRRMETAMRQLNDPEKANRLARDIALKRKVAEFEFAKSKVVLDVCKNMELRGFDSPNQMQTKSIRAALTTTLSLIQGPPGTGKTATGAHIAYLFSQINKGVGDMSGAEKKANRAQVMYCGPSNKSVDVAAGYLKNLKKGRNLCIIRVYSEMVEHKDFPLPGEPIPPRRRTDGYENSVTKQHRDIALHHMIRQNKTDSAKKILEYDKMFRDKPDEVTVEDVEAYQKLVLSCEVAELKSADIILCTCSASAAHKIKLTHDKDNESTCNINQVIIDECGMCMEPETMIPIVAVHPTQVVLIGDHKQLRPIILNDTAKKLGLDVSLFERYADLAIMLTVQYRMHDAIADFPSKQFYDGRLRPGLPTQSEPSHLRNMWPGPTRGREPIGFCHMVGKEEVLTVSSSEGNEQSRKNETEAAQAMKFAALLVQKHRIFPEKVVILSQYRAQCAEIEKLLNNRGLNSITVSTVVASQGSEWDYVILSTVRSLPEFEIESKPSTGWMRRHLGFITDQNQINVALTRARKGLIIIGNKHLLKCDKMWKELLSYYDKKGKVISNHMT